MNPFVPKSLSSELLADQLAPETDKRRSFHFELIQVRTSSLKPNEMMNCRLDWVRPTPSMSIELFAIDIQLNVCRGQRSPERQVCS